MLSPSGNPFKCHEEVLYLQPSIPPKRFYMPRRSRHVLICTTYDVIPLFLWYCTLRNLVSGYECGRVFPAGALSGGYAPDSAKAEGSSIVDEPGGG